MLGMPLPLALALLLVAFAVTYWLTGQYRKQQRLESRPRHRLHDSTTHSVLPRPTLPTKVITQATGLPPWETETPSPGSGASWRPSSRRNSKEEAFEQELDQAFLTAPLARLHEPEPLRHNDPERWWLDETPSMMRKPMEDCTMPMIVFRPRGMSLECRIRPDLTVPAGEIHWKACPVTPPIVIKRTIMKVEHVELALF